MDLAESNPASIPAYANSGIHIAAQLSINS
jgi:hypothetical protein